MRAWQQACLAATILLAPALAGAEEPALPTWNVAERAADIVDGGLLTADSRQSAAGQLDLAPPTAEEIAATDDPAHALPEKFWVAYFGERPRKFFIDPQGLLSASDSRARLGFLNYHAGDSAIDLFVYVFKGDQEIPGELRVEEVPERLFSTGRPAAIVFYYLGAPRRSVLYLSPSLTDSVAPAEQRRALENSVMQALEKDNPASQLEAFLVQMSIRIYWMERLWAGAVATGNSTSADAKPAKKPAKKSVILAKLQPLLEIAKHFTIPAAGLAGVLVIACGTWAWLRWRARYRFPVWAVEPRLGGDHAAGVGAVISFASATTSLASQREQRPDDPRRA